MTWETLLGDSLVTNDGSVVKTSDLSCEKGAVIGLLFSAEWFGPPRTFTPELSEVYKTVKSDGAAFEIVFVSWDGDDAKFKTHHEKMPWPALPFADRERKDELVAKYEINAIPTLLVFDASTGEMITRKGHEAIVNHGVQAFPFSEARIKEVIAEIEAKKVKGFLEMMGTPSSYLTLKTLSDPSEKEVHLPTLASKCEALAIGFMRGRSCEGSTKVLPALLKIQQRLGKNKLEIVLILCKSLEDFDEKLQEDMKDILLMEFGDKSQEVLKRFEEVFTKVEPPHTI